MGLRIITKPHCLVSRPAKESDFAGGMLRLQGERHKAEQVAVVFVLNLCIFIEPPLSYDGY